MYHGRSTWPSRRLLDLLEIDVPIIQAPMAGAQAFGAGVPFRRQAGSARFPAPC